MPFEVTTAVKKMFALKGRRKVVQGATSSGKTYGIIPILYDKLLETPGLLITVTAETIPALKDGAVKIFKDFLFDEGRWVDSRWIANPMEYTLPNRSKMQFKSFDTVGKAKASGKRDVLFMNEANHMHYEIADALMIRSKEIWLDFNADEEFWAHTELLEQPNTDFLELTYLDNEQIPKETFDDLMFRKAKAEEEEANGTRGYWWNWCQVYLYGKIGSRQGVIFSNWEQCDKMPESYAWKAYGIDWGYTNDPTAVIEVCEFDGKIWLNEILYEKGLTNQDIARKLEGFKGNEFIADSAEPKSIEDIRRHGFRIRACQKGRDSVRSGIDKLQQQPLMVTSSSTNLIKEFRGYTWAKDRTGKETGEPIDTLNHGIDAIRYTVMEKKRTRSGQYSIR